MEEDSNADTSLVKKNKRRVLKRVLKKKDKSKVVKPRRILNTSLNLSSLSKSLNRSVTSLVIKQTLQSNNRQLAMTLEKTRQELRLANSIIMDQKVEIVELQTQVSTYKHMAGLKPEEIENEVKCRMEKYISDLKTHLGKIGQQLFDATTSLGDAMDLCMNVSRRSTSGSCRSSTVSVMSDDEGDAHLNVRPAMFRSQVLPSDPITRNLPQRGACLDMSVIAEQSVLLDDIALCEDIPIEEELPQKLMEEEVKEIEIEEEPRKSTDGARSKRRTKEKTHKELIDVKQPENNALLLKGDNQAVSKELIENKDTKGKDNKHAEKDNTPDQGNNNENDTIRNVSLDIENISSKENVLFHKQTKEKENKRENVERTNKERRGTFVLEETKKMPNTNEQNDIIINKEKSDKEPQNEEAQKKKNTTRSKGRKDVDSLQENTARKKEEESQQSSSIPEKNCKDRRGTFVIQDTKRNKKEAVVASKGDSQTKNTEILQPEEVPTGVNSDDAMKILQIKERRETFVLPKNKHPVGSSKSQDNLSAKNEPLNPMKSKSVEVLTSEDDRRKTFLVPSPGAAVVPPLNTLQKISPQIEEAEVTEYFNCDMELTEVIDTSKAIILESSTNTELKPSADTDQLIKSKKTEKVSNEKKVNKATTAANKTLQDEAKPVNKSDKVESQPAVEFRVPKPGKIVFAASRKMLDGTRERVPTKLPQRSRSKTKVKLTKSTSDDENVKSLFDFHEKTPTVLKHTSSVYDLSMNESIHAQKESYSSFRDKINNRENATKETKEDIDKKEKMQPNNKGEIIYHLPLKGCSPDLPVKTKPRERSQSRGRSASRSKKPITDQEVNDNTDDHSIKSVSSRSRSRGRSAKCDDLATATNKENVTDTKPDRPRSKSRGRCATNEENVTDTKPDRQRSKSRGRSGIKNDISSETKDEVLIETVPRSRSRGRSRSRKKDDGNETEVDVKQNSQPLATRSRSRGRSGQDVTADNEVKCNSDDQSKVITQQSRSRGRSKTRKNYSELSEDDEGSEEPKVTPERNMTQSKSRGRSKSKGLHKLMGSSDSDSELKETNERELDAKKKSEQEEMNRPHTASTNPVTYEGNRTSSVADIEGDLGKDNDVKTSDEIVLATESSSEENTDRSRSRSKRSKKTDDLGVESKKTRRSRSHASRSKSSGVSNKELSDDEDFQSPRKSKNPKRKSKTGEEENLGPLDKLFKNARKKSTSDLVVPTESIDKSDELNCCNDVQNVFSEPDDHLEIGTKEDSFHVICETPLKPRDNGREGSYKVDDTVTDTDTIDKFQMDLKCVTKRGRSRKLEKKDVEELKLDQEEEMCTDIRVSQETVKEQNSPASLSDLHTENTTTEPVKGKRRHDSTSDMPVEKNKSKKIKKEDKENTGSSLSSLKKRLASLGTKMKPASVDTVEKTGGNVPEEHHKMSAESDGLIENELLDKRVSVETSDHSCTSQGKGLFTPTVDNVLEPPRSRRKAANVCYKEVSLNVKLRREDILSGKKLIGP